MTSPHDAAPCPACGKPGPHFVPPSLGEDGFYHCQRAAAPPVSPSEETPPAPRHAEGTSNGLKSWDVLLEEANAEIIELRARLSALESQRAEDSELLDWISDPDRLEEFELLDVDDDMRQVVLYRRNPTRFRTLRDAIRAARRVSEETTTPTHTETPQ